MIPIVPMTPIAVASLPWMLAAADYLNDAGQRTALFWDVLRKRGNTYLEHLKKGQPPVLVFDYEMILDGRTLPRVVNYALVRIIDRRSEMRDRRNTPRADGSDRRYTQTLRGETERDSSKRPIVVIDPRAGHGPGIGGAKLDSQIGVSLDFGHPVYFVLFFTDPEPGQTIADVQEAEVRFLEEVVRRHPQAPRPAVIGNCQAGWAAALIGADRPDVTGPMVFNGSPLSYWGGVQGANPMRYKGGLSGGVWLTSFMSDLGNGIFDGAHLVAGFEDLNPANTWWTKLYHLYANVDTEENRFLDFEKWWGGFFKMTAEEVHFIVSSLFIGNELEQGTLELKDGKWIHLKNFKDPIVVFASTGDNITPPPQALNWIVKIYESEADIKENGQVIVYLVHPKVGHLGIFVSGSVARREHREIIGSMEMIEYLPPGLYEMVIEGGPSQPWLNDHQVRFEERTFEDILKLDDGLEDEAAFEPVAALSRLNDLWYRTWIRPWVRAAVDENKAEAIRQLHPLRVQRYVFSDLNPAMTAVRLSAQAARAYRQPADSDNPFTALQEVLSETVKAALDGYRDFRDLSLEYAFKSLYGQPWLSTFREASTISEPAEVVPAETEETPTSPGIDPGDDHFANAVVRIVVAVASSDRGIDRRQFQAAEAMFRNSDRLKTLTYREVKDIIRIQSLRLDADAATAIKELRDLLPGRKDRRDAYRIAKTIAEADTFLSPEEQKVLSDIRKILGIKSEN